MKVNKRSAAFVAHQRERDYMEDRHTFNRNFIQKGWIFGGVYDGHGGADPAIVAAEIIPGIFSEFSKTLSTLEAFKKTYEKTADALLLRANVGGACAANFFIKENIIHHANVGDSHLVVIGKDVVRLTTDHRVDNEAERSRIIEAEGRIFGRYVVSDSGNKLMPTRTLGDLTFRSVGVTYEPSVGSYKIQPTDKWLIAGTDGLFDEVSLYQIGLISGKTNKPQRLADDLLAEVVMVRGQDNVTIIVMKL